MANTELTCELAMQIGRAAAHVLTKKNKNRAKILIGKDTRISSDMIEAALSAGICSTGADAVILGVVPTPAVALLVREYGADAGVMISASHNPVEYNGIKLFSGSGHKLSDDIEAEIEAIILDGIDAPVLKSGGELGRIVKHKAAVKDYISYIASSIDTDLSGIRVAIDCANGSASSTASELFTALGADCYFINDIPNGVNINYNCGSTHIESLKDYVIENRCHLGVAFDGDADRCLAVDEKGNLIDGDMIIAIFAKYLKDEGRLAKNSAVVTVMSNLGFFKFAEQNEINAVATKVGDRYVLEEMLKEGYNIGGEQSGHIIFSDYATTGDGQLSAVQLLSILKKTGKSLSKIAKVMERYPQVMVNVTVDNTSKSRLDTDEEIKETIAHCNEKLNGDGRVLVRASGTEPLIRVMVEGKDDAIITECANCIADKIKERLS